MAPTMIVLYRPVDEGELAKIEQNGYRRYPPLVGAFVVYAQEKFARTMVGPGGWLTRFTLTSDVIGRYTRDGASPTEHYLIPPSDIDRINESIVGPIQVLRSA